MVCQKLPGTGFCFCFEKEKNNWFRRMTVGRCPFYLLCWKGRTEVAASEKATGKVELIPREGSR